MSAILLLSVGDDNGKPYWTDFSLAIAKECPPEVTSRVNRLLNGFAFNRAGLTNSGFVAPKIGMNWRTGKVSATFRRRAFPMPVLVKANPSIMANGTVIVTRWSVQTTPAAMETNIAAGFSPLTVTPKAARKARPSKATVKTSPTATVTPEVTPLAPKGAKVQKFAQTVLPTTPKVKSVLPAVHPGVFAELARKPYAVHVDSSVQRKLAAAYAGFVKTNDTTVVCFRGPSGAGKTLTAMDFASANGLPFAKFEVQGMRDFADWYGSVGLSESNGASVTAYVPSDLSVAIDANGPYGGIPRLILLDEVTRAETAGALNALLALTDGHGTVYVPDARKSIVVDSQVMFVFTANIGSGFNGALPLDTAVANRVTSWITVDYPTPSVEAKIIGEQSGVDAAMSAKFVQVATQLRAMANRGDLPAAPSTRQLVRVGKALFNGLSAVEAYEVGFADDAALSHEGGADSDKTKAMTTINAALR